MKNKKILIAGGGIAGPALAWWLNKYGFEVTIVEKAASPRKGGYRVDLRGAGATVAQYMGLMPAIRASRTALEGSSMIDRKGQRFLDLGDPDIFGMRQKNDVEIKREDLAEILYTATKDDTEYIFNDVVMGMMETEDGIMVSFKHSAPRAFDLVVGADGLHSKVRRLAFGPEDRFVKKMDHYFAVFSVPNSFGLHKRELSYRGHGMVMNIYSDDTTQDAKVVMIFSSSAHGYDRRDVQLQKELVYDLFRNEGAAISSILDDMLAADDFYFDAISQVKMKSLSEGRVVLLGDAGYCPSPASGQGTSLAMVGAYVLAGELAKASGNYHRAFAAYQQGMQPFIDANQRLAASLHDLFPGKFQLKMQNMFLRLIARTPWKEKIFSGFLKEMQQAVNKAAVAIHLSDHAFLAAPRGCSTERIFPAGSANQAIPAGPFPSLR